MVLPNRHRQCPGTADSGFFVLLTPLLPADEFVGWSKGIAGCEFSDAPGQPESAEHSWQDDVALLRGRLREIVGRPEVLQALFVASPTLASAIPAWNQDPDNKEGLQTERGLVHHFSRFCLSPTTVGLASGFSIGNVVSNGEDVNGEIVLRPRREYLCSCRLDLHYLIGLTNTLCRDPAIATGLLYFTNSSLHRVGNDWHYVESRIAGSHCSYRLVKLDGDEYLNAVIDRARTGASLAELVHTILLLPDNSDVPEDEAQTYMQELIESEVLVSNLSPPMTGKPPLDEIIARLKPLRSKSAVGETLDWARDKMTALHQGGLGASPEDYRGIASALEGLPATLDIEHLYCVDLIKPLERSFLSASAVDELARGAEILYRIGNASALNELTLFREAFLDRYNRRQIPLLEALDEEIGLGIKLRSYTEGFSPVRGQNSGVRRFSGESTRLLAFHDNLLRKVLVCPEDGRSELPLNVSDLPSHEPTARYLPDAFVVSATLAARSFAELRDGEFKFYLRGVLGPSDCGLLAHLSHSHPELLHYVRSHLREAEALDPEAVHAEVVHLPGGKIGDSLCRPVLRDYEIPYLGRSGAPLPQQLPMTDLLVSIEKERVVLHSKRLGKRIVPQISNPPSFKNSRLVPVYQFLRLVRYQDGGSVQGFPWGALRGLGFLPRVRIGRVVLARARWRLRSEEVNTLKGRSRHDSFVRVQELRRRRSLPRWIVLLQGENSLPVDLDNPLSVDAFADALESTQHAILEELYPSHDDLCVTGPEGRFQHEALVPFVRRPRATKTNAPDQALHRLGRLWHNFSARLAKRL